MAALGCLVLLASVGVSPVISEEEETKPVYGPWLEEFRTAAKRGTVEGQVVKVGTVDGFVQAVYTRPYEALLCSYPWHCSTAYNVMWCESRGNPQAYNAATKMYGLMQISSIHAARVGGDLARLYEPETNARIAYQLYTESGWSPWAACL